MHTVPEVEKITDRASLVNTITTAYREPLLDLYTTHYDKTLKRELVSNFDQEQALDLIQEIITRYHLPVTKITTLADNIYEMNITLASGNTLEHVGRIGEGKTLTEKATLQNIAQTILDELSNDEIAEIAQNIKSGKQPVTQLEIVVVPYTPKASAVEEVDAGAIKENKEEVADVEIQKLEPEQPPEKDILSENIFDDLFTDLPPLNEESQKTQEKNIFDDLF